LDAPSVPFKPDAELKTSFRAVRLRTSSQSSHSRMEDSVGCWLGWDVDAFPADRPHQQHCILTLW